MFRRRTRRIVAILLLVLVFGFAPEKAFSQHDFGLLVQQTLERWWSEVLFGVSRPLGSSSLGNYNGADNALPVETAAGLHVSVVSNATDAMNDMIALWPRDNHPTHLFIAAETAPNDNGTNPSLQLVDLSGDPNANTRTILTGLANADTVRRTPWGTIIVGEESSDGGVYEIFDPLNVGIGTPARIIDRMRGLTSDPAHVYKRQALGSLAFEGIGIMPDGTTYYGDERRPGEITAGGSIYKYVPLTLYAGSGPVNPYGSPYAAGAIYGLRLGTGNSDNGQGAEIGKGTWVLVRPPFPDINGNINLRTGQDALRLTGYYRPEDMEVDELAFERNIRRVCWANTGRMTHGNNSTVEYAATYGELMCLVDEDGTTPFVTRFFAGGPEANSLDNIAFQPGTGRMVVLEDGAVEVVTDHGTELRGDDIWMLLPDGRDRDVQSDGAIRILSLTDTDAEPTGWIFEASGEIAYVNIQHRKAGIGAVLKISGFKLGTFQ